MGKIVEDSMHNESQTLCFTAVGYKVRLHGFFTLFF